MQRTPFNSYRALVRDLLFPMCRIIKEDWYELSLIIVAVVWTAGSLIASILFPTGNWFCRSGAVMVLLAVMVDFNIGNLQQTHISNASIIAGREYIAQLGLYDYRNKVYSPVYGRFLQTDPIRFQGGDHNIYRYCGNNPINGTDPLGLCNQQSQPVYIAPPDQANNVLGGDLSSNQASDPEGQGAADAAGSELAAAAILAAALGPAGMEAAGMDAAAAEASPVLNPANLAGRTATEIDAAAQDAGLIPKGPSPITGEGAYVDPVTGEQRVLIHPDSDTPHMHVNDPSGARLDINGNTVSPESPAAHLPLGVH